MGEQGDRAPSDLTRANMTVIRSGNYAGDNVRGSYGMAVSGIPCTTSRG